MIVADRAHAETIGLEPAARLVAHGISGVEPGFFGLGPVPATRQALERAGWTIGDVERFEINEAFAAVALTVMAELGIDPELVNVEGGAVAHGHPIGATGAILATRLIHSMRRDGLRRGHRHALHRRRPGDRARDRDPGGQLGGGPHRPDHAGAARGRPPAACAAA